MTQRPFRFGVAMLSTGQRAEFQAKARQAEDLGYDILQVGDHLGMPAPFTPLVSAAEATSTIRVGTFVINSAFYRPALLAREAAEVDQLTDGRLELGLGTGAIEGEFELAGLPFPSPGERVDHLAHTVSELRRMFTSDKQQTAVHQRPLPPLMVAGLGNRVLRLAAREADIVALPNLGIFLSPGADPQKLFTERLEFIKAEAGERFSSLEVNLFVLAVSLTGPDQVDLSGYRPFMPALSDEQILQLPNMLIGSPQEIADTLLGYRETHGVTYFSVLEPAMADFAKVISLLR